MTRARFAAAVDSVHSWLSRTPFPMRIDTKLPNGQNYGFVVNTQRILANKAFVDAHPDAKKLFSEMKLPVADINAQNKAMHDGANKPADIERHVNGWIKAHQQTFDQWIVDAKAAAQ